MYLVNEADPFENVKTNIMGHQNVIESVSEVGDIETLIFVSTDKACNPINVYGMCKSISEKLYIEYAKQRNVPKVVLVRYGNVLESTGSVIPFFKSLLEKVVRLFTNNSQRYDKIFIKFRSSYRFNRLGLQL